MIACLAVSLLSGCTTSKVFLAGEIADRPGERYVELVRPAPLIGVVIAPEQNIVYDTLNGRLYPRSIAPITPEVVTFDSSGGTVDVDQQTVTGVDQSGSPFTQGFVELLYLQVKEVDLAKKFVTPMELTCDKEIVASNPRKRIKHGSSPCWDVIEFDGVGGHFDSASNSIIGVTKRGTTVSINSDEILQARTNRKNFLKSTRFVVIMGGIFLFANGANHFWDGY